MGTSARHVVTVGLAICIAFGAPAEERPSAQTTSPKPNVVVIMADDLDAGIMAALNAAGAIPNIKTHLIDRGLTFTNAYVSNASCCPSRATFLTGQYSHNHNVRTNHASSGGGVTAFNDRNTLATWLQGASYRTALVGKYLNGYGYADVTGDGQVTQPDIDYIPPGWTDWQALVGSSTYSMYEYDINDNGQIVRHGSAATDYQTDVLAARAERFIQRSNDPSVDDAPFFLLVTPVAPHAEVFWWSVFTKPWYWGIRPAPRHAGTLSLSLPLPWSFNEQNFSDKPAWMQQNRPQLNLWDFLAVARLYRQRVEAMRAVDDLVGRIVASLEAHGELENTVLIFTSDNGYLHGEHRQPEKYLAYEESIKVPLYARVPGAPGGTTAGVALNSDLAPTIAALAGVVPQTEVDGASFVPLLHAPGAPWRQRFLVEHWQSAPSLAADVPTYVAVRTFAPDNLLYVQYDDATQTPEFYDMASDPLQVWSLHAVDTPLRLQQQAAMRNWITALRACRGWECRQAEFEP